MAELAPARASRQSFRRATETRRAPRAHGPRLTRARSIAGTSLLCLAAFTGTATVHAAFIGFTSNDVDSLSAGSVAITNNGTAPLYAISGGALGSSDAACLTTTSTGTLPSTLKHYATATGTVAPYLDVLVEKGAGAAGYDDCTGFAPDPVDFRGLGAGVLYDGTLAGLGTSWANGTTDPAPVVQPGTGYGPTVAGTSGLVNRWRLGETTVEDTFAGPAGATIQSRTGERGATWTKWASPPAPVGADRDVVITAEGRMRRNGDNGASYYASGVPASADYAIEADLYIASATVGDTMSLQARATTDRRNWFNLSYSKGAGVGSWRLIARTNGTDVVLATFLSTADVGRTYHMRLEVTGTTAVGYVDGVERLRATSATPTAAGGVAFGSGGGAAPAVTSDAEGLHLDNIRLIDTTTPTSFRDSRGTASGTWFNSPTAVAGIPGGDDDRAMSFDGVNDYGTAPRQIADDLTLSFWFRSTQGLDTSPWWYGGAGLVNADTATAPNGDFGTSLRSDGRIAAGTGGSVDTTMVSSTGGYNDGQWHHVALTRVRATGAAVLYVDGLQRATVAGGSSSRLDTPATITFGRQGNGGGFFAGSLDEVSTHDRALSATEVANLYNSQVAGLEVWTTGEQHAYRITTTIRNDPAASGTSGTVTHRWEARNR